jgi:hypothetical protein
MVKTVIGCIFSCSEFIARVQTNLCKIYTLSAAVHRYTAAVHYVIYSCTRGNHFRGCKLLWIVQKDKLPRGRYTLFSMSGMHFARVSSINLYSFCSCALMLDCNKVLCMGANQILQYARLQHSGLEYNCRGNDYVFYFLSAHFCRASLANLHTSSRGYITPGTKISTFVMNRFFWY